MESLNYVDIQEGIANWAELRQDIRAVFILGSRGHSDPDTAQSGSDLDVLIVASHPQWYRTEGTDWCHGISPLVISQHQEGRHMVFALSDDYYVVFKPDLDVDFSIVSLRHIRQEIRRAKWFLRFPRLSSNVLEKHLRARASAFRLGFRVLLDRESLMQEIIGSFGQIPWLVVFPAETEFLSAVDAFLIYTFKAVKKVHSGKLFHAKWICDTVLKMQLIRMAEWHVRSQERQNEPIRYRDLAVDKWADPRVRYELPKTSPGFDSDDIYRALYAGLNLFYWVAAETAKNLGYQDALSTAVDRIEWLREYVESVK